MWGRARKIKPSRRDQAPTVLMTVGVSTKSGLALFPGATLPSQFDGAVVCVSRRHRSGWTPVREFTCDTAEDVWTAAQAAVGTRRKVYAVSCNALDDLTLLGHWQKVEGGVHTVERGVEPLDGVGVGGAKGGKVRREPLVFGDRCDVIGFTSGHVRFRWVSVTNWADLSMRDIAESVGYAVPEPRAEWESWRAHPWPAADQARLIMTYMQRALGWWVRSGCGTWRDTPGAAAWSTFTRQGTGNGILQHEYEPALILEDRACFGGRATVWYCGPIGSPARWPELAGHPEPRPTSRPVRSRVHRYDVRAMYPTLLRDCRFPIRLIQHEREPGVKRLGEWLKGTCVVAAVRVRTDAAVYPVRGRDGPIYPVGQFDTVLTTPELLRAHQRGEIQRVYEAAVYTAGSPFRTWGAWVLNLRDLERAGGNKAGELLVKTLANSLGGRIGRKRIVWEDAPGYPCWSEDGWGRHLDCRGPEPLQLRAVAWRVQQLTREDYRPGTLGACYAHLTAYGRCLMNDVRELLTPRQVLWQDTDGLLVTESARLTLERSEFYHPDRYGKLRHEGTFADGQLVTAKHYWLDGRWTLAGVANGFAVDAGGNAAELRTANPVRRAERPVQSATYTYAQKIDLADIQPGARLDDDQWVLPPRIWVGERPTPEPRPEPGVLPFWSVPHEDRPYGEGGQLPD